MDPSQKQKYKLPNLYKRGIILEAQKFLSAFCVPLTSPIPIEDIIDLQLGITICPTKGLKAQTGSDAFINDDYTTIFIDDELYFNDSLDGRKRFTLAHEIGHMILHQEVYKRLKFQNIKEYVELQNSFCNDEYGLLEWQAFVFAGYVLMPRELFRKLVDEYLEQVGGLEYLNLNHIQDLSTLICVEFNISAIAAVKQIKHEYKDIYQILDDARKT